MAKTYPKNVPGVTHGEIDDQTLHSIGRLIRATAEIEDTLNLFICKLAGLSESRTAVMLGRSGISRKLAIAETLAKLRPDKALATYKRAFPAEFGEILECRNAVAHGTLIGISDVGEYTFLCQPTQTTTGQSLNHLVYAYNGATISGFAVRATAMIPYLEEMLKVQDMRAERLQRPLLPHPKSQDRGRATQKTPPQS